MFSFMKFFNNASAAEQAALKTIEAEAAKVVAIAHNAKNAAEMLRPDGVLEYTGKTPPVLQKPSRPADTPARAFVGNTLEQLTKARDNYTTERDLLAKDIAKLTDEHGQLETSLAVLQVAIDKLAPVAPVPAPTPTPPAAPWADDAIAAAAANAIASELGGNTK